MRRLVVLSALLVLAGFLLLLPSSQFWSLLTTSSAPTTQTTPGAAFRLALSSASNGSSNTKNDVESILGFGAIAVGLILEVFSLFTDVGGRGRAEVPASVPAVEAGA